MGITAQGSDLDTQTVTLAECSVQFWSFFCKQNPSVLENFFQKTIKEYLTINVYKNISRNGIG